MRLNYNRMENYFDERYGSVKKDKKKYYYNKEGKIVATSNNKVLTTFYKEEQTNNIYTVSIIRKMYVGKGQDKKVIDAMYIEPMNEFYKETELENNFAIKTNRYKECGMQKEIETIGIVKKGKNGERIFKNQDFQIEIPKREYIKRDFFNLDGVYLLNLQTQYKTKKLDYNEVYDYYKKENKWIYSEKNTLGKENAKQFIKKRNIQSYDGIMHPVIKRIK